MKSVLAARAAVVLGFAATDAYAQLLPKQTAAEQVRKERCERQLAKLDGEVLTDPVRVIQTPDDTSLGVAVVSQKWLALAPEIRLSVMRDLACFYVGGRMIKKYWYDYAVIDGASKRVIETYTGDRLWPGPHYR